MSCLVETTVSVRLCVGDTVDLAKAARSRPWRAGALPWRFGVVALFRQLALRES